MNLDSRLRKLALQIESLDINKEAAAFAQQVRKARPELFASLLGCAPGGALAIESAFIGMARLWLGDIKEIPVLAQQIVAQLQQSAMDPAMRCSLLLPLVYLVQPADLIPDDAPGGYGFVDDCIMLRAAYYFHVKRFADAASQDANKKILDGLIDCLSKENVLKCRQAIDGVAQVAHAFRSLEPQVLHVVAQQMIDNPLATKLPFQSQGASPADAYVPNGGWDNTSIQDKAKIYLGAMGVV